MGVPYEIQPMSGIAISGGDTKTVEVIFPSRGYISKVVVQQTNGAEANFTVELFNHKDALEGTESSASDSEGDQGKIPLSCRRVGPVLNSDSLGILEYFSESRTGGAGFMFCNMDTPIANRKVGKLYVRITPGGAGEQTYALTVGGESALD